MAVGDKSVLESMGWCHTWAPIFHTAGEEFFPVCIGLKNVFRGGDVFNCRSLGEEEG